ncbi:MAG: single-stranded-DNA-specific exonuclease RecJ [Rickettsiaceae bacterium H1]|nr:single-stranded-DNA-specific exonuclease RecJ [Rickettsiaceae bacterium H1]
MNVAEEKISLNNKLWELNKASDRDALYIMQKYKISEITARIIITRNINNIEEFFNPLLRTTLPDPFHLLDIEKGIDRAVQAIKNKEKIAVFGDYDVDGATSSALLKKYFAEIGLKLSIYIPDRTKEGYGPNASALKQLKEKGINLCITVDCGTVAHEPLLAAKEIGLDVIVIDHHLGNEVLPKARAIINPNRLDENSQCREIAAVGVTFLFLIGLNKVLRDSNFFNSIQEPDLYDYLDLVALGTVCDVMPLTGLNRALVTRGLKIIAKRKNLGIRILSDILEIYEPLTSYHLGFLIGPQINAGGRVGQADLGAKLLSASDEGEAKSIAKQLIQYNKERQKLEKQATEEAIKQAENNKNKMIIIVSYSWHPGIIGLVSSRVKDFFYRPTIIITIRNGIGKASCRSVSGIDIGSLVLAAKLQGLIIEGGGHKMAAGFSVEEEKIERLNNFFNSEISQKKIKNVVKIDGIISPAIINLKLWYELQKLSPFGLGNPEPKFILANVSVKNVKLLKEEHISCIIFDRSSSIKGIAFRSINTRLGKALISNNVNQILGKIKANYWQGRTTLNFLIEDAV